MAFAGFGNRGRIVQQLIFLSLLSNKLKNKTITAHVDIKEILLLLFCTYIAAFIPSFQRIFQTLMVYDYILFWQGGHKVVWELGRHKTFYRVVGH